MEIKTRKTTLYMKNGTVLTSSLLEPTIEHLIAKPWLVINAIDGSLRAINTSEIICIDIEGDA